MYRGSADLFRRSARHLAPLIELIAQTDRSFWEIDADCYNERNIEHLCNFSRDIKDVLSNPSETLITKIMLGVFGNTPAFDTYFKKRCKSVGITGTFNETALTQLGKFFDSNAVLIEANRITTLNFLTGERDQSRKYTRAKVIDMLFFAEGQTSTIETQSSIRKYRGVVEFED